MACDVGVSVFGKQANRAKVGKLTELSIFVQALL